MYPSICSTIFQFFVTDVFDGDGEDEMRLLRVDRSIDTTSDLYRAFFIYDLVMIAVFPIGVPLYYWIIFFRNRHDLRELKRIESTQEANYKRAMLLAAGKESADEKARLETKAMEQHEMAAERYDKLREKLPTILRKLTAGYELRTYWFEILECIRKILLVGVPVFCPAGCECYGIETRDRCVCPETGKSLKTEGRIFEPRASQRPANSSLGSSSASLPRASTAPCNRTSIPATTF